MKLGTRLFVFSSVFLVMLPWFAFHFIEKIEHSLLQGQEEAQSMVASAIATVLSGYSEIFNIDEHALYVHPANNSINIDGYEEDWGNLKQRFTPFSNGAFSLLLVNTVAGEGGKSGINTAEEYFYVYLKVVDDNIVYRNPRYFSLDSSDHVRLEYIDVDNNHRRLVLLAEGQGNISAYEVKQDWVSWLDGKPVNAIYGVWRETKGGYSVELRLPRKWLQPAQRFSLGVVDVFSENERYPEKIVSTHSVENTVLNPLLFQSQKISSVLKNLSESDSRICVIDRYRRVRAVTGGDKLHASFCQAVDKVSANLVNKVLQPQDDSTADDSAAQVEQITENGETLIIAARAVFNGDEIIGAVLVSKNSQQILALQRDTLNNIVLAILGMFLLVFFSLLIFSSWLAFRINRLNKQISTVIDDSGRLIADAQLSDRNHGDEIGDLSRSFESMLLKLNSYTNFLETVPRMLRHEILNPINTISMSLQSMSVESESTKNGSAKKGAAKNGGAQSDNANDSSDSGVVNITAANISTVHINTANNAIKQLQLIVSSLTEAANIDEALTQDETEKFDVAALLDEYVCNLQSKHKDALLRYEGAVKGVFVNGNDIRLVQLFDKIKDNALDFSYPDTEILFTLDVDQECNAVFRIKNEGEIIPQQQLDALFHGMVSQRSATTGSSHSGSPHLGIGLYVAHKIAQFHKGQLQIVNRRDKQGVEVSLILPLVPDV